MKATDFITAKYLTAKVAGEYNGKQYIIDSVFREVIGQGGQEQEKLCVRFKGIDKPLPLNQTNLTILSSAYGDDTDMWINKKVTLRIVQVKFDGELVKGIQVEITN